MTQRDPYSSTDVLEPIYRELRDLKNRVAQQENKSIPTVPKYDPLDFPQDSVEGQLATAAPNELWAFIESAWHQIGGSAVRMPIITGTTGGTLDTFGTFSISGINGVSVKSTGGFISSGYDTSVYSLYTVSAGRVGIQVDANGLYAVWFSFFWYRDWNNIAVQMTDVFGGAGGSPPFLTLNIGDIGLGRTIYPDPKYGVAGSPPHSTHGVSNWMLMLKNSVNPIQLQPTVELTSGSNRTADSGVIMYQGVMQLSTQDSINP